MIAELTRRHTPTISDVPFLVGQIVINHARREAKKRRSWWRRVAKRIHVARFSPNEVVESNLPLR